VITKSTIIKASNEAIKKLDKAGDMLTPNISSY
jgi:hypothetical protein